MSDSDFYSKFEERNRGSRELILSRLKAYNPFVNKILETFVDCKALDIGCGRGEWLELLNQKGIQAKGIDINQSMLNACFERGLDVLQTDGLKYLAEQKENSLHIISAFHVVEHISFEKLQKLISDAFFALVPGGLLILETPNPENIAVATKNFYLDPTHIKPIPPVLLSFLSEYSGFKRNKIVRLQETAELADKQHTSIADLINGVSPDYAIIAQKPGAESLASSFDIVFNKEYGLSIDQVSYQFDRRLNSLETRILETEAHLTAVFQSRSWRITQPLRDFIRFKRWFMFNSKAWLRFTPQSRPRRFIEKVLLRTRGFLIQHPWLNQQTSALLSLMPRFKKLLRNFLANSETSSPTLKQPQTFSELSPRAQSIYQQLEQFSKNKDAN